MIFIVGSSYYMSAQLHGKLQSGNRGRVAQANHQNDFTRLDSRQCHEQMPGNGVGRYNRGRLFKTDVRRDEITIFLGDRAFSGS